jgi:hypothetical protein
MTTAVPQQGIGHLPVLLLVFRKSEDDDGVLVLIVNEI